MERSGIRPQRNHGAHARAYCAGEGGRNAPQGVRGATPASEQARAAPKGRARERERFPVGYAPALLYLILGHYFVTTL